MGRSVGAANAIVGDPLTDLQKRRERLKRRAELIVSTLDDATLVEPRVELDRLKVERRTLDEQIAVTRGAAAMRSVDPGTVADAVLKELRQIVLNVGQMPVFTRRQLLGSVVGRVVVDMETKAVELHLVVPLGEISWGTVPIKKRCLS